MIQALWGLWFKSNCPTHRYEVGRKALGLPKAQISNLWLQDPEFEAVSWTLPPSRFLTSTAQSREPTRETHLLRMKAKYVSFLEIMSFKIYHN